MKKLPDNSVDSIVTDPPYGLKFMGKKWDYEIPSVEIWQEAIRVLKPGGHLLSFGGSRTYHRMAVAIEDAGFEIRDQIMWVYGSGFPKSHNIGKAVDKRKDWKKYVELSVKLKERREELNLTKQQAFTRCDFKAQTFGGNSWFEDGRIPSPMDYKLLKTGLELDDSFDLLFEEVEREILGKGKNWGEKGGVPVSAYGEFEVTKGTSPYEGWGTALKPAHEPICMARKPLSEKTVALNVIKWGCGGINIDGCRVGFDKEKENFGKEVRDYGDKAGGQWQQGKQERSVPPSQGRFPANFIHDGSDEVVGLLGEPARFFYFPKASKKDRNEGLLEGETSTHPCVKPTSLMQYLVRLVTPKGGICLDPFMGSGSTGKACALEGFDFIGIELDPEYFKIAEARIENI